MLDPVSMLEILVRASQIAIERQTDEDFRPLAESLTDEDYLQAIRETWAEVLVDEPEDTVEKIYELYKQTNQANDRIDLMCSAMLTSY